MSESNNQQKPTRFSKRARKTILVLALFIVMALVSAYLYHNTEGNLSPEVLQQQIEENAQ